MNAGTPRTYCGAAASLQKSASYSSIMNLSPISASTFSMFCFCTQHAKHSGDEKYLILVALFVPYVFLGQSLINNALEKFIASMIMINAANAIHALIFVGYNAYLINLVKQVQ